MKKINKKQQLSTVYKKWENDLEEKNTPHPKYNSSQGEYYIDIVMDLLRCQNGLCAYTEVQLCPPQYLTEDKWVDGRYKEHIEGKVHNGQLEHFDERLKWKEKSKNVDTVSDVIYQKKDWLWSNLFLVDTDTNNRKSTKSIDDILKPDLDNYDPFKLFDYSSVTHMFTPNTDLPKSEQDRIRTMIDVLGINFTNVVDKRRQVVTRTVKYPLENEMEFPTAVEFYKKMSP
jgi:hypothetical protein